MNKRKKKKIASMQKKQSKSICLKIEIDTKELVTQVIRHLAIDDTVEENQSS